MAGSVKENPDKIEKADLVVGVQSEFKSTLMPKTVEALSKGLKTYFPDLRSVIVNIDSSGDPSAKEAFFSAPCEVPRFYIGNPKSPMAGKGANIRSFLKIVARLDALSGVCLDAGYLGITPKWIRFMAEPLLNDFGFVSPIYTRHKYDDALTNNLVYPLTRCLYGRRVRQPIAGDFGLTGEMAKQLLDSDTWTDEVSRSGIDIWLSTQAMLSRTPITQAFLGIPKVFGEEAQPGDPNNFRDVVTTVLNLEARFENFWKGVRRSRPTAIFGVGLGESEQPKAISVDAAALYASLIEGEKKYKDMWSEIFSPLTHAKLSEVLATQQEHFELPAHLWAQALFDVAVAFRDRVFDSATLVDALEPLFAGKTLSFVQATEGVGLKQAEEYLEEQCLAFEDAKSYLLDKWGVD